MGSPLQLHERFAHTVTASKFDRTKIPFLSLHTQLPYSCGKSLTSSFKRTNVAQRNMSSNGGQPGKGRGPVSWTMLGVVGVAAAAAVAYYRVERERRLEKALGTIVSVKLYLC